MVPLLFLRIYSMIAATILSELNLDTEKTLNNNKMTAEIKTAVILLLFYLYYHFL